MNAIEGIRCLRIGRGRNWIGCGKLVRIGAPAAGQILLEVGAWNLSTFAAGYLTPVALATHTIALNYASISYMVPLGIGAAAAVSVGHAIGAGDPARARRAGWMALALGTGFMVCAGIVFLVAPRPLIPLYTHDRARARGGAEPAVDRGGVPDFRWNPDGFDGSVARTGRNTRADVRQPGWLLGNGAAAGFHPVFRTEVGNLRDVDRADAVADCDCDCAAAAMASRFRADGAGALKNIGLVAVQC